MKVLLVEDEDPKRDAVVAMLTAEFVGVEVQMARSVRSAIAEIRASQPGLLLLDMSLPTFDIAPGEPGGRPQSFGGIEVLRFLDSADINLPAIVITAYEAFPKANGNPIGFEVLAGELRRDYPALFKGLIHFDPILGEWGARFCALVRDVLDGASA